jgi:hypothetical protein
MAGVNTIAATTNRVSRPALIGIIVLVVAFVALMLVRTGVLSSSSEPVALPSPPRTQHVRPVKPTPTPAKPRVVLLPGLPSDVAHALRYSKVIVVSLYVGQAPGDRETVVQARTGARAAGAGFVAVNVGSDKKAAAIASFAGPVSSPSMLVIRRPGKIVTQISGPVESAVVTQAAHNAGARR